jgi:TolB-like protein/class 3 adenylate cyclase/rhodanese-related sulfurtransferase
MESKPLPLKLAAILYADVAEYSRLTGEDEQGTHRRLSEYLDLISKDISRHNGRVVHYAGDAVLADFGTVVDALVCAASVQRELSRRSEAIPEERKVRFRIGVNLGDVIEDRGDIYGDGVNVAARLESLAEPGGICISESVHTAVGHKLPFDYEYMGEQEVKNIAKPLKAYRARLQPDAELPAPSKAQRPGKRPPSYIAVAAVVVLIVIAAVLGWQRPWEPREEPASLDRMAYPLPDKPSIAVLPFTNMSADPQQEYFADGVTEDLITDLSKLSGLFVIARNSTFAYKGKSVDVRQVAEDLGVHYVLEGSVRRANGEVRINAQLIDALSGGHVWAERYDSSMNDVFEVQDEVTGNVVAALKVHLTDREREAGARQETISPQAYDAFLRGRAHYENYSADDSAKAISYLEKAVELDPSYARAHALLAWTYWQVGWNEWESSIGMSYDDTLVKLKQHLKEALKNPTPLAYQVSSRLFKHEGKTEEALTAAESAIDLDPNNAAGYAALARIYTQNDRLLEGLDAIKAAIRLDPEGDIRGAYSYRLGEIYFHLEQFEESAEVFEKYTEVLRPGDEWGVLFLASVYGHLGRIEEAQSALEKFNNERAKDGAGPYTLSKMDGWNLPNETIRERYREGLRKAGMPQGAPSPPVGYRGLTHAPPEIEGATTVDVKEAKRLFDQGIPFVAVNTKKGWDRGHLPGAVHLDGYYDFTEANLSKVVGKNEEVVIYSCGTGCGNTARAVATAVAMGFENVYYFRQGFPGWKAAGHPIEVASK